MFIVVTIVADAEAQIDSPHGVEVVIRGNIVLVVTRQAELVAIALMNKVPQFFGAQGLREASTNQSKNMKILQSEIMIRRIQAKPSDWICLPCPAARSATV